MSTRILSMIIVALLLQLGCTDSGTEEELMDTSTRADTAEPVDTRSPDTTSPDTASSDTAEPFDTRSPDTTSPDTAQPDTAMPDTGPEDTAEDLPDTTALLPDGAACGEDAECASGSCPNLFTPGTPRVCAQSCSAGDTTCPEGQFCFIPGDVSGVCLLECPADRLCDGDLGCAALPTTASQEDYNACLPDVSEPLLSLGHQCADAGACASGGCAFVYFGSPGPQDVCVAPCNAAEPACPKGTGCYIAGDFAGQCLPTCDENTPCADPGLSCFSTQGSESYCLTSF